MSDNPLRMKPITRTSLAETAYEAILDAILSGRLRVGEEVSEVSLASDLGISRTPVAQAVRQLASVGLIERLSGRVPRIAKFDRRDIIEIYEIRQLLEAEAATRAAGKIPRERLEAVQAEADWLVENRSKAVWVNRAIEFDIRFHDEIALASGNRRVCEHIRHYRLLVRAFCRSTGHKKNLENALQEHRAILDALVSGDSKKAGAAMADHIRRRMQTVLDQLFPVPADDEKGN